MAHFTQLGLSGSSEQKPESKPQAKTLSKQMLEGQRPQSNPKQPAGKHRTAMLIGSLIATALLGVFLLESGCSKESDKTAVIATPGQTASQQIAPIPATALAPSTAVASQPPAKKKARQRRLAASTYTNPTYGVSFRYPTYGNLKEGDEANLELDGMGPLETNFIQPGGDTITAVELPRKLYAGTDFNAAFFNVSVNPKLTAEQCGQFAFPESTDPDSDPVVSSKTKVGVTEFRAVEGFAGGENNQADVKYYHVFQNGSCYEFALGLETAAADMPDKMKTEVKPVNRNEVFRQLNWILSTVKIQSVQVPQKTAPEVAGGTTAADTTITEVH
jgi:hypothetical protein